MCERTVEVLKELFGNVTDEDTIESIAKFYNGSLTPSIEMLMKMTNSNQFKIDGNTVTVDPEQCSKTVQPSPSGHGDGLFTLSTDSSMSYRAAIDKNGRMEFKDRHQYQQMSQMVDILNIYSNKKNIEKVINGINDGHRVLILMRGLPGSGKSTLAKSIIKLTVKNNSEHIFSADDFFYVKGKYMYSRDRISDAHEWNQKRVLNVLSKGVSPVIVDNTNIELWEMQIYATNGVVNGYIIEVVEAQTPWSHRPGELARKSIHNIPPEKIKRMYEKYVKNISGDYLLDYFRLEYSSDRMPPQQRLIPKTAVKYDNINNNVKQDVKSLTNNIPGSIPIAGCSGATCNTPIYKQSIDSDSKSKFDLFGQISKPQRSSSGSRRNGLLKNFTDVSEWKSIDDWESIENGTNSFAGEVKNVEEQIDCNMYKDASTQTANCALEDVSNYKQLIPVSRSINIPSPYSNSVTRTVSKNVKLDKGMMTDEDICNSVQDSLSRNDKIKELKMLFEHIPNVHLLDILERCNGDVNWACEILLDANINGDNIFTKRDEECEEQMQQDDEWDNTTAESFNTDAEIYRPKEEAVGCGELSQSPNEGLDRKREKHSLDICNLKRQIEENFVIADDYYSNHVLQLRKRIHGEKISESESSGNTMEESGATAVLTLDDNDNNNLSGGDQDTLDDDELEDEDIETVSVRVGHDFICELNRIYKAPSYDTTLEPVIHIPATLLNQIHALWIESLCNQIDVQKEHMKAIIQEDEDFARKLLAQEEEEEKQGHESNVPNLREIMEMEMDLARYNMAHSDWKKESPNDLATKLSKQKLIQLFPDLNENVLMEVLHAYNYNFGAAFEDLLLSTGVVSKSQTNEIDPKELQKILAEQEQDLINRAIKEKNKQFAAPIDTGPSTSSINQDTKELVEAYRQEAKELMSMRNRHHSKAQEYFNRKMFGSANYYSNLANLYTKKHDYINTLAASEIVQINTKDNNTLDLHCFYVKEALQALDMYLDQSIRTLRERSKKPFNAKLFLITGRGIHSPGQNARIKPAVKRRLKERKLHYSEVNPGLLSVVVTAQDVLTDFM